MTAVLRARARATILRYPPFAWFFAARVLSELSQQIAAVAVGWQIYTMTNSAAYLGLAGLAQFVPTALLTFVAGGIADRFDRKRVAQLCQAANALTGAYLALGTYRGWLSVPEMFFAVTIFGVTTVSGPALGGLAYSASPVAPAGVSFVRRTRRSWAVFLSIYSPCCSAA